MNTLDTIQVSWNTTRSSLVEQDSSLLLLAVSPAVCVTVPFNMRMYVGLLSEPLLLACNLSNIFQNTVLYKLKRSTPSPLTPPTMFEFILKEPYYLNRCDPLLMNIKRLPM